MRTKRIKIPKAYLFTLFIVIFECQIPNKSVIKIDRYQSFFKGIILCKNTYTGQSFIYRMSKKFKTKLILHIFIYYFLRMIDNSQF